MSKYKPRVLITGINGFVGSHLAELLMAEGYQVSGMTFNRDLSNLAQIESQISLYYGDICEPRVIEKVLSEAEPDYLYHLAGMAFVPDAKTQPKRVFEVNVFGILNVLEALRKLRLKTRTLVVGSAEVYGKVSIEHLPVNENYPLTPTSLYGVTKASADMIADQYSKTFQMDVIRVRSFNHFGPRQSEQFVCSSFAKQIVEIEMGLRDPILFVGNLDTRRDFTDVRDIVRGYRMILESAPSGAVYNVGSNKAWAIGDLVKILIEKSTAKKVEVKENSSRVRSNDIPVMLSDASKLLSDLNWKPEIPIEQTLQDLLEYWREKNTIDRRIEMVQR